MNLSAKTIPNPVRSLLSGLLLTSALLFVDAGIARASSPPDTVEASVTGSRSVRVSWTGATGAQGYLVLPIETDSAGTATERGDLERRVDAGSTSEIFTTLTNGASYTFSVKAIYSGAISVPRVSALPVVPSGPPTALTLTLEESDAAIDATWTVAENGSPVSFVVELFSGTSTTPERTSETEDYSETFGGLSNGQAYRVKVTATNINGSVTKEDSKSPTAGIVPPTDFTATPGNGSVGFTWLAPVQTGDGDLDGYVIEITDPTTTPPSTEVSGELTSYSWTGLRGGTQYTFRIKSINAVGEESDWSSTITATPTGGDRSPSSPESENPPAGRVGGDDRFQTASLISQEYFATGVDVVFLATGSGFADALAGGAASEGDGPMLLVSKDAIPATTATELDRLNPGRIVVLGGESVVSAAVLEAASAYTSGTVTRIGGADRFETAAQLSAATFSPGVSVAYVATGLGFADALAVGPAALGDGPVLLVTKDSVPASTATELDRLNPGRIVVLGGESVVSAAVLESMRAYTTGTVTRIGGADRYETSVQVSAASFSPGVRVVFLATGANFADALAAGPVGAPILLTKPTCVPRSVLTEITRLNPTTITVLGGTSALSAAVRDLTSCT